MFSATDVYLRACCVLGAVLGTGEGKTWPVRVTSEDVASASTQASPHRLTPGEWDAHLHAVSGKQRAVSQLDLSPVWAPFWCSVASSPMSGGREHPVVRTLPVGLYTAAGVLPAHHCMTDKSWHVSWDMCF